MMGIIDGDCSLGKGVNVCLPAPPPPRQISRCSPKTHTTITGRGPGHTPLTARVPAHPTRNWTKQQQDALMGGPLEFFPTHMCDSNHLLA